MDIISACLKSHLTDVSTPSASGVQGFAHTFVDESEISHPTSEITVVPPSFGTQDLCQYTFSGHSAAVGVDFFIS